MPVSDKNIKYEQKGKENTLHLVCVYATQLHTVTPHGYTTRLHHGYTTHLRIVGRATKDDVVDSESFQHQPHLHMGRKGCAMREIVRCSRVRDGER